MKATYLLIKSSVLSVTSMVKPKEPVINMLDAFSEDRAKKWEQPISDFSEAMKAFNESFIPVRYPDYLKAILDFDWANITEGVHPVEGIQFEVKEKCQHKGIHNSTCIYEKVAVVSLVEAKQPVKNTEYDLPELIRLRDECYANAKMYQHEIDRLKNSVNH